MNEFNTSSAAQADELLKRLSSSTIPTWYLRESPLLPIVQGGMGVGVSASRLAGTVAGLGGMGTISAVDLRRLHPDLMEQTEHLSINEHTKFAINTANREALRREIEQARQISAGRGALAINVMRALSDYSPYVQTALESGIDAVVVGAGLPLDLPELAKDHPHTALIPILSDARGVQLIVRKWEKKGRLPDAIVIEHPGLAGGHLGAAKVADIHDVRFDFDVVLPQVREFLDGAGLRIPLIAAGGMSSHADLQRMIGLGASAIQLGTAFAVTQECDAHEVFKRVLAQATPEDLVEFISVAGLPARAVRTPWMDKYLRNEEKLKAVAHVKSICHMGFDCLATCGFRDGKADMGQFCIDQHLGYALAGDEQRGLFFRGGGRLPFGDRIRPVAELMQHLLGGKTVPAA